MEIPLLSYIFSIKFYFQNTSKETQLSYTNDLNCCVVLKVEICTKVLNFLLLEKKTPINHFFYCFYFNRKKEVITLYLKLLKL